MKRFFILTSAILLLAAACNKQADIQPAPFQPAPILPTPVQPTPAPVKPSPVPSPAPVQPTSPPASQTSSMIFDVTKAKVGDKIGSMTITLISGKTVVKFKGPVTITGTYIPQVSDLRSGCPQFRSLDPASLAKIPRISGDNSAFWFCFDNPDFAKSQLGSESKQTTVTIDNYAIDNRQTETVSDANLISVQ